MTLRFTISQIQYQEIFDIEIIIKATNLLVELDPGEVALRVSVLEAEEPDLAEADGLDHLVEELLSSGRLLDRELQLRVHRRHPDVHLELLKILIHVHTKYFLSILHKLKNLDINSILIRKILRKYRIRSAHSLYV